MTTFAPHSQAQEEVPAGEPEGGPLIPDPTLLQYDTTYNETVTKLVPGTANTFLPEETPIRPVSVIVTFEDSASLSLISGFLNGEIIHQYSKSFNGASLITTEDQVPALEAHPAVTGIYPDRRLSLNANANANAISHSIPASPVARATHTAHQSESGGLGVTIGILDSGIWPEHPSFAYPGPTGQFLPTPAVWPGQNGFAAGPRSTCDFGNDIANSADAPFTCNHKLIGAYTFLDTYKAVVGLSPTEFDSARDDYGHGTHVASTAGGNAQVPVTLFDTPQGTISGVAPDAHIIAYKVCGELGCFTSDIIAAIEQAILDEVDVINYSVEGEQDPYNSLTSQAFLTAYEEGIFVAAAAGNHGPELDSVSHLEPWVTTVGAHTSNRQFQTTLRLTADNKATLKLVGTTLSGAIGTPLPVVVSPNTACEPQPADTFKGEIVICNPGDLPAVLQGYYAAKAGAGAMILRNTPAQELTADNHFLPTIHIDEHAGEQLDAFLNEYTGVTAAFDTSHPYPVQEGIIATFSGRGGPQQSLGINKPDLTAPGIQILGGHTPVPSGLISGPPGQLFQAVQGTSFATPQVAGTAALIKAEQPHWSPGQVKSAIMLTSHPNVTTDGKTLANPFETGTGGLNPVSASLARLTMDETAANFSLLADELWLANYPSLFIPAMPGRVTIKRTFQSQWHRSLSWKISVNAPSDVHIEVPPFMYIRGYREETLPITIDASQVPLGEVRHASLTLYEGEDKLHFPITIVRQQPVVEMDSTCELTDIPYRQATECSIHIQKTTDGTAAVELSAAWPNSLRIVSDSVDGATVKGNTIQYSGELTNDITSVVQVAVNGEAPPFGYTSLGNYPSSIVISASDESISNFTVPSFNFAGETYNRIGIVSNGYIVVGGGSNSDISFINTNLPNPASPNNVLAPFWTDLNPSSGGRVLINTLTAGINSWIVVEWERVRNYVDGERNTFQVWIQYNDGVEHISYAYGPELSNGDLGFLTVGAEDASGETGGVIYINGNGTQPSPSVPYGSFGVEVFSTTKSSSSSHTITFNAEGQRVGAWQSCTEMDSDAYFGTNVDCIGGYVKPTTADFMLTTSTGRFLEYIHDGDVIDLAPYESFAAGVYLRGRPSPWRVGSMVFDLNGAYQWIDNKHRYLLPTRVVPGTYVVSATPTTEADGNGLVGFSKTVTVKFIDSGIR